MQLDFPTARSRYPQTGSWSALETKLREQWHLQGRGVPFPVDADDSVSAYAEVNVLRQARWIVKCPFGCGGAVYADPDDHRFLCDECWNAPVGGKWVPVVWPPDPPAVEALLKVRPHEHSWVFTPGETLKDLREQNKRLVAADVPMKPERI